MKNFNFYNLALLNFVKQNLSGQGQSLIGIIIVLVTVGLISGGLYYYLSKQLPEIPEIAEKPAEEEVVNLRFLSDIQTLGIPEGKG